MARHPVTAAAVSVVVVAGALLGLRWWLEALAAREARRHAWRMELATTKAAAWKAEALEELRQRVARMELRGVSR